MNNKNVVQKVVLGGVIVKNKQILIVQRSMNEDVYPGLWELPGGKKEDLETAEEALIREIKEEVGVEIVPVMPFDVFNYTVDKPNVIKDSTQINYLVKPKNKNNQLAVVTSEEHQDYKWIKSDELDNYNLSDLTKQVIQKAFKLASILSDV